MIRKKTIKSHLNLWLFSSVGLAVSDLLFCIITLLCTFLTQQDMIYNTWSASLFFTAYGPYFQNLFIKISTTVTVIMAVYRHLCVHCPVWSKQNLNNTYTMVAVVLSFVFWSLFKLPILWTFTIKRLTCTQSRSPTVFVFSPHGKLQQNPSLYQGGYTTVCASLNPDSDSNPDSRLFGLDWDSDSDSDLKNKKPWIWFRIRIRIRICTSLDWKLTHTWHTFL